MDFVIETENLTKRYKDFVAADSVNMHVKKGEIYGLLGRNGAGKTTVMKMILGLTQQSEGKIWIFGKSLKGNEKEILSRTGALIEAPSFYPNLTATENLKILARLRGTIKKNAVEESLRLVGLPYKDKKLYSEFSLGMKQRLGIAAAVMHSPELLILDEPINGLDPIGIAEIRSFIKELVNTFGKTVVLCSHILSEIEMLADTVGIMHKGKLLEESSLKDLKEKNKKYILLGVASPVKAVHVLDHKLHLSNYQITEGDQIRIYDENLDLGKLNRLLVEEQIEVWTMTQCNDSLEDYFKKITGGEGIA